MPCYKQNSKIKSKTKEKKNVQILFKDSTIEKNFITYYFKFQKSLSTMLLLEVFLLCFSKFNEYLIIFT